MNEAKQMHDELLNSLLPIVPRMVSPWYLDWLVPAQLSRPQTRRSSTLIPSPGWTD